MIPVDLIEFNFSFVGDFFLKLNYEIKTDS